MSEPKILKFSEVAKLSPADTLKLLEDNGKIIVEIKKDVFLHLAAPSNPAPEVEISPSEEATKIGGILLASVDKTVKSVVEDHFLEVSNRIETFFGARKIEFDEFMEQVKTQTETDLSAARAEFDRQIDAINQGLTNRVTSLGDELSGVISKVAADLGETRVTEIREIEARMRQSLADAAAVISAPIVVQPVAEPAPSAEKFDLPVEAQIFEQMAEAEVQPVAAVQIFDPALEAEKLIEEEAQVSADIPAVDSSDADSDMVFFNIDSDAAEEQKPAEPETEFLDLIFAAPGQGATFIAEAPAEAEVAIEVAAEAPSIAPQEVEEDDFEDLLSSFKQSAPAPAPAVAESEEDFDFLIGEVEKKEPSQDAANAVELDEQAKDKGYSFDI